MKKWLPLLLVLLLGLTACKEDHSVIQKDTVTVYLPVAKITYDDSDQILNQVTYTYDERGLLLTESIDLPESFSEWDDSSSSYITTYMPCDGVADQVYTYSYDEQGNLTSYRYDDSTGGYALSRYTYTYGEDSKILSFRREYIDTIWKRNSDVTYTVEYDGAGNAVRLTSVDENGEAVVHGEYSYDAQGNLITAVLYKDTPGKYTYNFTYNESGALTSFTDSSKLFDYRYSYNEDGLLICEENTVSTGAPIEYTYQDGVLSGVQQGEDKFLLDENGNATQIAGQAPRYTYQAVELRPEDAERARSTWIAQNPNPYMSSIHVSIFTGYPDVFFRAVPHPRWSVGPMLPAYIF